MSFDTLIKRFIGRRSFWKGTQLTFASLKCAFVVNQFTMEYGTPNSGC